MDVIGPRESSAIVRRFATLGPAAAALVLGLTLSGCAAGHLAETRHTNSTIDGVNASVGANVLVRNGFILVPDAGVARKGGDAVFHANLLNGGTTTQTVSIVSPSPAAGATALSPTTIGPLTEMAYGQIAATFDLTGITSDLRAGNFATVTLRFEPAGQISLQVPIVSANDFYATFTPSPSS